MAEKRERLATLLKKHSLRQGQFVLASGEKSSIYLDVKSTSLLGEGAALIGDLLLDTLESLPEKPSAVGGLTLGADPLVTAMVIAAYGREIDLAAIICRKGAKSHGTKRAMEHPPTLMAGDKVVAIDDVITSGASTLQAIEIMRTGGFEINAALCVVDRNAGGREALEAEGVEVHALFTLDDLTEV